MLSDLIGSGYSRIRGRGETAAQAAAYGGILYTDKPENDQAAKIEPKDAMELDMNRLTTMPEGLCRRD